MAMEWNQFYNTLLEKVPIPATTAREFLTPTITVRDLVIDLNSLLNDSDAKKSSIVTAFADVVQITADMDISFPLGGSLVVVTRRLEVKPGVKVRWVYSTGNKVADSRFTLYATEIPNPFTVTAVLASAPETSTALILPPAKRTPYEVGLECTFYSTAGQAPTLDRLRIVDENTLATGSPFHKLLRTQFQIAVSVFYEQPEVALSILTWINTATVESDVAADVHLQSVALLAQLQVTLHRNKDDATFVPPLNHELYLATFEELLKAAELYEAQYTNFINNGLRLEDRKGAAQLMQGYYQDCRKLQADLIERQTTKVKQATLAMEEADRTLLRQQNAVKAAQEEFKEGIEQYEKDQKIKAALGVITAVVTFGAAIGAMCVGDVAAAPAAAKGVADGAKAVAEAEKTVGTLEKAIKLFKKIKDTMEKLYKLADGLNKLIKAIQQCEKVAKGKGGADAPEPELREIGAPDPDGINSQAAWDAFREDSASLLQYSIEQGIDGAQDYLTNLQKLCIFGKSYVASKIAVIRVSEELSRLQMQQTVDTQQVDRLQKEVNNIQTAEDITNNVAQTFFERQLNIKIWVVIYLQNYIWAYNYWGLAESHVKLSAVKSVAEYRVDKTTLSREFEQALLNLGTAPAPWHQMFYYLIKPSTSVDKDDNIRDSPLDCDAVASLKRDGHASFSIQLDDPAFNYLGRFRLTGGLRIWLEGVPDNKNVDLRITSSGVYDDKFRGQHYSFTTDQFNRVFKYKGFQKESGITSDGKTSQPEGTYYLVPTPFTEWTVKVLDDLDLSGLTGVLIEFFGINNTDPDTPANHLVIPVNIF
ncbi:hypothetical protein BC938DRAFT_473516 [Jimgerdemannia flammicorona]|uniref:Uncharacterized protein n=1 Tax=Jimgerdemannia flammicorona TaxID=994334 RepID=A0A433QTC8_9FUNG|nr:hypothetical protein BC938DRAFT_473516 [Jimgerdemannia flammicorona]